ncbi:MAG: PSD1 and planctomycete cytochrome C domain-containing protein [Bryobacterales bacterium]|nr:PSD1 and planctomycete cytochrome C domain-containing protein [Bryobacterales bacterium]
MAARIPKVAVCAFIAAAGLSGDDRVEFFENRVRPLLATKCWTCHSSQSQQGGLRLDSREGVLRGGSRGPALIPGKPAASLVVQALRHEGLQMPLGGKLSAEEIADVQAWILDGAVWPSSATRAISGASSPDGPATHWAFRPVTAAVPPRFSDEYEGWLLNDVDRFILAGLETNGLIPANEADRRTLIRRISFDLTGLPPRPEDVEAFARSSAPNAYEALVERLLGSETFGEHWARHWMDWVRYCESHGSQGDFTLPYAWRYRDYLIRAFNADVPYDQMLREYLAGDLLEEPRTNSDEGLNESMHGTANLRMVEYGYVPVDALDDQVKVVDNQIDVLTKAFQGLTVSCARCHDHKFDPITQADFFALYGILASSRPGIVTVDSPERLQRGRTSLESLREKLRAELSVAWTGSSWSIASLLKEVGVQLDSDTNGEEEGTESESDSPRVEALVQLLQGEDLPEDDPLRAWLELRSPGDRSVGERWRELVATWFDRSRERREVRKRDFRTAWDLRLIEDASQWFGSGPGLHTEPSGHGEFRVHAEGDRILSGLLPAGLHSGLDSQKFGGILGSPRFRVSSDSVSLRVFGRNFASVKLIVENYPIGDGGTHPMKELTADGQQWIRLDSSYRRGQMAYLQLQTLDDRSRPFWFNARRPERKASEDGRSAFGITEVVFHDTESTPPEQPMAMLHALSGESPPETVQDFEEMLAELARQAAEAWAAGTLTLRQTAFLDWAVRRGLLPSRLTELPDLQGTVDAYREAEQDVPIPRRAPGVLPGTGFDQPLFSRGDHTEPTHPIPRRYLELLGSRPFRPSDSGRLELAGEIASADNPLTARVLVNRLWHYLFGSGIVSTVDNFGTTGEKPSHPLLLDYLAARFVDNGWSIKETVRLMVLSRAYRMTTQASPASQSTDPENRLLQHQNVRRLPAESIRDGILETSGDLDRAMYGPSIGVYFVGKTEGVRDKGPLDGGRRRSVYQAIRRNAQNPLLEVFDAPKPSTTRGRRDVTNIPAQSLALLNDPFVVSQATRWADRALADGAIAPRDRVIRMFRRALGRVPDAEETDMLMTSLAAFARERGLARRGWLGSRDLWADYAQSLFNLKEFIYLR